MAKVTLVFTGVAMIYRKDGKWKIIFPFDDSDCHRVQFEYAGEHIALNKPGTEISITVTDGSSSVSTDYDKFFDLTSENAHPDLRMRGDWRRNGNMLTISGNVAMSIQHPTKSRYQLKRGGSKIDLGEIAFSAKTEIELGSEGSVKIDVTREGKSHRDFPRTFQGTDGSDIIVFNNNCFGNPSSSKGDLQMLYDYIIDVPPSEQFTIERREEDQPTIMNLLPFEDKSLINEWLEKKVNTVRELIAEFDESNATEKSHNPYPKELGLPCYIVKAEDSTNLS